ncbi:hypothetical protein HPHPP41_0735 [Helicobacter pylori Hp P-41]|nr:hypothetical protein HPHPP41_0735 [Helicobacter pylori Hp P-41]
MSVSKLVNSLKGVSSRLTRQHHFKSVEASLWGSIYGRLVISLGVVGVRL